jgi:hypothetical protein
MMHESVLAVSRILPTVAEGRVHKGHARTSVVNHNSQGMFFVQGGPVTDDPEGVWYYRAYRECIEPEKQGHHRGDNPTLPFPQ